ncbi:MAG: mannose-1-phosphate guanylyltransferase [Opitutaceae bacterium]|nr:mannose-1-phosphate guanylyltransferase [Opitutaceae bacterium]
MIERYIVIMAGGKGERFWPQSRLRRPKQLLPIVGDSSMLNQTVERLSGFVPIENVFVLTNSVQRDAVLDVCPQLLKENVVAEPVGRDTAAAVALATFLIKQRNPEGVFAILPADHIIYDQDAFHSVLNSAFGAAEKNDVLVTIGIVPTEPATGYGYIHQGEEIERIEGHSICRVERFVEKPDLETAKGYVSSMEYLWNGGMFIWQVNAIEQALKSHVPELYSGFLEIEQEVKAGTSLLKALADFFPELQKISIDYAVMEKADNVVTVPANFDWDDVGEWGAIVRHSTADSDGNTTKGSVVIEEGSHNLVISSDEHLIALVGVDDLIVVRTADATLVCRRSDSQKIKNLVERLGKDEKYKKFL